jgi:hypothetical protein
MVISLIVFLGFGFVQIIYREAFNKSLQRSHYLQRYIGDRLLATDAPYKKFEIYENVYHPVPKIETIKGDLKNPRFIVPNLILCAIPFVAVFLK